MEVRIWISFDLGADGDYAGMYAWLDSHNAVECGDSMASLLVDCESRGTVESDVLAELQANVQLKENDRIYLLYRREDNMTKGTFLVGNRKESPWKGKINQTEK
jgi:hypothetical protein